MALVKAASLRTAMSDPKPRGLRATPPQATPIPPSLQAKMAAFANRASPADTNQAAPLYAHPVLNMAARRARPNFSLRDIVPNDGPSVAGLGAGRPAIPPRKPPPAGNFGSPFSNFSKIVYVPLSRSDTCS